MLSSQQLFRAKLHALNEREAKRDYNDLMWLCMNYGREIQALADTLDKQERIGFLDKFLETHPAENAVTALMDVLKLTVQSPGDLPNPIGYS